MNWRNAIQVTNYTVIILPLAKKDIYAYTDYIAYELSSPKTALKMAEELQNTINTLSIFPYKHQLDNDPNLSKLGIRTMYYKKYKIFFSIFEKEKIIYILRVIHTSEYSRNINKIINSYKPI